MTRLVNKLNHPLIVGCNYRYTTQRYKNAHFMLVDINSSSGKARLVTRTTNKDFWIDIDRLIYLHNENNQRKAQRIKTDGADYLKTLIGYKHAENWLKRQEAMA